MNLSKDVNVIVVSAASAAATTPVTSAVVDMSGWDGVVFVAVTGALTTGSVVTLTVKENTANSTSSPTPTAITGGATPAFTSAAGAETLNSFIVDIFRPQQRYLFAVLTRTAANAVVNTIIAIQYRGMKLPPTLDATVLASAFAAPTT